MYSPNINKRLAKQLIDGLIPGFFLKLLCFAVSGTFIG